MKKLFLILALSSPVSSFADNALRFGDCVEIISGFYSREGYQVVGTVRAFDPAKNMYLVGDGLFPVWVDRRDLKKVDKSLCAQVEVQDNE